MTAPKKRPGRPRGRAEDAPPETAAVPTIADDADDGTVAITVREGTLVVVDGQQVGGEVRVPRDLADEWIRQRWADPA
ncbi:MAG TPA: hypothetical protein DIW80_19450 [Gordonia polyisoprenivorans]|uniref:hypothetical protein n=1 Tax=uncultured Gordonia sp. TaxID=198437 RepID=UPI000EBDDB3D|nr:hypothetical protein [uncultured Gordonia sp.]HCS59060.1 hypothetical protein [Gordonia polyisoprenivorans]